MKLKIVNAQEKEVVYAITDTTERYNMPALKDSEILLIGYYPEKYKQYGKDDLKVALKENDYLRYNIFINSIKYDDIFTDEEKLQLWEDISFDEASRILNYLNMYDIVKISRW